MFNEILEGGLNQLITRRFGMKGAAAAPAVAPEVFPTLNLENDRPEWGWLKGENLLMAFMSQPAVSGQTSIIELRNPANSGSLCVLEDLRLLNTATVNVGWHSIPGSISLSARTPSTRDGRNSNLNSAQLSVTFGASALAPVLVGVVAYQLQATGQALAAPVIIPPGRAIVIYTNAVNTQMVVNLLWRERVALPGELV